MEWMVHNCIGRSQNIFKMLNNAKKSTFSLKRQKYYQSKLNLVKTFSLCLPVKEMYNGNVLALVDHLQKILHSEHPTLILFQHLE